MFPSSEGGVDIIGDWKRIGVAWVLKDAKAGGLLQREKFISPTVDTGSDRLRAVAKGGAEGLYVGLKNVR